MLTSISPIDGRYAAQTAKLQAYFSEYALIRYRLRVEVQYFIALCRIPLPQLEGFPDAVLSELDNLYTQFYPEEAGAVKQIEQTTNHDVKAVEYYLKSRFENLGIARFSEFVHFGLTSQDINNTAMPLLFRDALENVYYPDIQSFSALLADMAGLWKEVPMLARTHGQPASPTRLGKELEVFLVRLQEQVDMLKAIPHRAKFGGATGNFNAHAVAYPEVDWHDFADRFVAELGLERSSPTTQIEPYDHLAAQCHALMRINTILIGFCRDMWSYISMEYFRQKTVEGEVGSSAMPHKVNPIDFENAEGNLGVANALFAHFAEKLPISRLQRDLTDSTVLRNLGVPVAHTMIALKSLQKGLGKIVLNQPQLQQDLENNWMVVSEAIQTILRREGFPQPYEALKALTRGKAHIGREEIHAFIHGLSVPEDIRTELLAVTPFNYTGLCQK